jgi:hypothetical protein
MRKNYIAQGLTFAGVCVFIGLVLALIAGQRSSNRLSTDRNGLAAYDETALVEANREEPQATENPPPPCRSINRDPDGYFRPAQGGVYFLDGDGMCRSAPTASDLDQVADELRAQGLTVTDHPVTDLPFTPREQRLIEEAQRLETLCRGGSGDDSDTEAACDERGPATDRLNRIGICWGRENEAYAEYEFHRCGPDSIR